MAHRMVEHGAQLVMERFQIYRGIGLAILVLIACLLYTSTGFAMVQNVEVIDVANRFYF